ncbi:phycoerythrin alpha subunit 2 [Guillardia theta CCMP2712]|uniref:Phycoerythrin alpha subunit 2 n=3 Tax=Guillardia theta TaxID=55529 RepID=L1I892_GUITC|nr:phycoerythrin alpha subunit 2 [Guillardia theta CCMP2712]EKX32491.1 phycoerythrin alpha subunit 2 [Guillardia theta CCMP2712]|eukprot:XP_005819471.1 phycoerythrin alpha subunit 2 [Guillardia theta CCMP2712]
MLRTAVVGATIAVASAFAPAPALRSPAGGVSMQMERREAMTAGAAAAAVFGGAAAANAIPLGTQIAGKGQVLMRANFYAPEVTIFDHRGCNRAPKEYKGGKTGDQDDEMLVRVKSVKVFCPEAEAAKVLASTLSVLKKK